MSLFSPPSMFRFYNAEKIKEMILYKISDAIGYNIFFINKNGGEEGVHFPSEEVIFESLKNIFDNVKKSNFKK